MLQRCTGRPGSHWLDVRNTTEPYVVYYFSIFSSTPFRSGVDEPPPDKGSRGTKVYIFTTCSLPYMCYTVLAVTVLLSLSFSLSLSLSLSLSPLLQVVRLHVFNFALHYMYILYSHDTMSPLFKQQLLLISDCKNQPGEC